MLAIFKGRIIKYGLVGFVFTAEKHLIDKIFLDKNLKEKYRPLGAGCVLKRSK